MPRGGAFNRRLVTLQSSRLCTDICVPESRAQGPPQGLRVFLTWINQALLGCASWWWVGDLFSDQMLSHPEACHLTHLGRLMMIFSHDTLCSYIWIKTLFQEKSQWWWTQPGRSWNARSVWRWWCPPPGSGNARYYLGWYENMIFCHMWN